MSNKHTVVVGDLHGKYEIAEKVLKSKYNVVFVGDYVDSYDRSIDDSVRTIKTVVEAAESTPERVTALMGNHDYQYMPDGLMCSRFKGMTQFHLKEMGLDRVASILKPYTKVGMFTISHAGVSSRLLECLSTNMDDYLLSGNFDQIGYARGGTDPIGGLYWCDWFEEFEPVIGVPQIVGHSGYRPEGYVHGILSEGHNYNVDCLQVSNEVLLIGDTLDVEVIDYNDL